MHVTALEGLAAAVVLFVVGALIWLVATNYMLGLDRLWYIPAFGLFASWSMTYLGYRIQIRMLDKG